MATSLTTFFWLSLCSVATALSQYPILLSPHERFFDVQGRRGSRGNTIENTLPAFAWGLIHGATTLELDNGITKDGVVVVWHDCAITKDKCRDTVPAYKGDPDFPYVGKLIANLTFAQIRQLDCGSKRQAAFPLQLTYPRTRISSLEEVFDFVTCADPANHVLFNIESKVDAVHPNRTVSPKEFARRQYAVFSNSPYLRSITYQSFDWRTLSAMKKIDSRVRTSALVEQDTAYNPDGSTSPWLAGLRPDAFPGSSLGVQLVAAAKSIGSSIFSPHAALSHDPDFILDEETVKYAHALGLQVKPWTVNDLTLADQLLKWRVDGIISDYPDVIRRWAKQHNLMVAPKFPKQRVLQCLDTHIRLADQYA